MTTPLSGLRTADEIRREELAASWRFRVRYLAGWLPNEAHIAALRLRARLLSLGWLAPRPELYTDIVTGPDGEVAVRESYGPPDEPGPVS